MWKVYEIKTEDGRRYVGCTSISIARRMAVHRYQKKPFVMEKHDIEILLETASYDKARDLESRLISEHDLTNPKRGYNRRFGDARHGFPKYVYEKRTRTMLERGLLEKEKNPMFGKTHSEETREKIRRKALSRHPSTFDKNRSKTREQLSKLFSGRDAYHAKHGHTMLGKSHTPEAREKISNAAKGNTHWLGRKHSEATKKKISESKRLKSV